MSFAVHKASRLTPPTAVTSKGTEILTPEAEFRNAAFQRKMPPAKDTHSRVSVTCHRISRTGGMVPDQDQFNRSLYPLF